MSAKTNHQITGARIPVFLLENSVAHEFLMSPMSDVDISEIDLWLQSRYIFLNLPADSTQALRDEVNRVAATLTAFAGIGANMIDSIDGVARFAWQAMQRNHPGIKYTMLQSLMKLEANRIEFNEKFKTINEVDYSTPRAAKPAAKPGNGEVVKSSPPSKITVYCMLAELYSWTFAEIAAMTPLQQLSALTKGRNAGGDATVARQIQFATAEDYDKWLLERLKNNNG